MKERTLTTLIFGNVVIESNLRGAELRIYSEDWRAYQLRTDLGVTFRAPLDDIRGTVPDLIDATFARALGGALAARARGGRAGRGPPKNLPTGPWRGAMWNWDLF